MATDVIYVKVLVIEAEIYATDECVKSLLHLDMLIKGLNLKQELMPSPTTIFNDNAACIAWSQNMTTKGLRHIQILENAVRESVINGFADIKHIAGDINIADIFTKEDKDLAHFQKVADTLLTNPLSINEKCLQIRKNSSEGGVNT